MLGFPILYFRGMRLKMFQLSGFCCISTPQRDPSWGYDTFSPRKQLVTSMIFCHEALSKAAATAQEGKETDH